jgi:hypothetical protein
VLVAYNQIPSVEDWFARTFNHKHWQARNACQRAALSKASQPAFARVVKPGDVNETQKGYYIERVILGEMGNEGREELIGLLYVGLDGKLLKIGRQPLPQQVKPSSAHQPGAMIERDE